MMHALSYYSVLLYRDFAAYTSGRLQELGLSQGLMFLLLYVGRRPGCTQSELTKALGLDWGYGQRSTLKLVEDGFLLREKEGRAYCLRLSEKGENAFRVCHEVFFDWDRQALDGLSEEKQTCLLDLLKKVKEKKADSKLCTRR